MRVIDRQIRGKFHHVYVKKKINNTLYSDVTRSPERCMLNVSLFFLLIIIKIFKGRRRR